MRRRGDIRGAGALAVLTVVVLAAVGSWRAALGAATSEGIGLATRYPGDKGLAKDPHVLYFLDFDDPHKTSAWHGRRKGYG